jgi:hypothetical protein
VLKLSQQGAYQWHTFYGASQGQDWEEAGHGIVVNGDGLVAIVGHSTNSWDGDGGVPPVTPYNGPVDTFILALDKDGVYQQHRFYGRNDGYTWNEPDKDIAADEEGNFVTTGVATASWLGDGNKPPVYPHGESNNRDIEVVRFARLTGRLFLPLVKNSR